MTKKEAALQISVGEKETSPVPDGRRAVVPELDMFKTDSATHRAFSEGLQKS